MEFGDADAGECETSRQLWHDAPMGRRSVNLTWCLLGEQAKLGYAYLPLSAQVMAGDMSEVVAMQVIGC